MSLKGKRILVIGRSCSGKSTYAKDLSESIDVDHVDMDDLYWEKNWVRPDKEKFQTKLEKVLIKDEWILSGNYLDYLDFRIPYCTDIVLLDATWHRALYRYFIRIIKRKFGKERHNGCGSFFSELNFKFILKKIVFYKHTELECILSNHRSLNILRLNTQSE